ncbi:MAG: hypothetical protein U0892_07635 [Pirellulales bacterium]
MKHAPAVRGQIRRSRSPRAALWLVVRVVTQREESYRMVPAAPYYFECAIKSHYAAVEMFQGWFEQTDKDQPHPTRNGIKRRALCRVGSPLLERASGCSNRAVKALSGPGEGLLIYSAKWIKVPIVTRLSSFTLRVD